MRTPPFLAVAAAIVLAGASISASAAPVDISSGTGGFVGKPGAGAFADDYTFTLTSSATVSTSYPTSIGCLGTPSAAPT